MRIIARTTITDFIASHPETRSSLERWLRIAKSTRWTRSDEEVGDVPEANLHNAERVRFAVHGGDYRMIAAFDVLRQVACIEFIGTHAEYDRVDALTVSNHRQGADMEIRPIRTREDHSAALARGRSAGHAQWRPPRPRGALRGQAPFD